MANAKSGSQFDGYLTKVGKPTTRAASEERAVEPASSKMAKSKDPIYRGTTFYIKRDTHAEAAFLVKRMPGSHDLSEIMQDLLERWIVDNRPKL